MNHVHRNLLFLTALALSVIACAWRVPPAYAGGGCGINTPGCVTDSFCNGYTSGKCPYCNTGSCSTIPGNQGPPGGE
jgi:hypothetical protein